MFSGDLPRLKRLLRCGLKVDAGDYDKRTVSNVCVCVCVCACPLESKVSRLRSFKTGSLGKGVAEHSTENEH